MDYVEQKECSTSSDRIQFICRNDHGRKSIEERGNQVLNKLGQALQKSDFIEILKAMEGYEVTIRLLDPPLHEFLPNPEELVEKIQKLKSNGNTIMKSIKQK